MNDTNVIEYYRFCWGSLLWSYTNVQMRGIFKKQAEYIRDYADDESAKKLKYTVLGFLFSFKVSFIY